MTIGESACEHTKGRYTKKLKLDLDDLKVESFDTTDDQETNRIGTVHAYHTGCPPCTGNKLTFGSFLCTINNC